MDVGRTVTIKCPFKTENAPKTKALYKKIGQTSVLVIDSRNYVNPNYKDRIRLRIPGTGQLIFTVVIDRLRLSDHGLYLCQAGDGSNRDEKNADLQVLEPEPELVYEDLRGSVTFHCALGLEVANVAKFLCRVNSRETCDVVINTLGKRDSAFEGRILLNPQDKDGSFSVVITGLRKEDEGRYLCGAHSDGQLQEGWPIQAWQLFVNEGKTLDKEREEVGQSCR